MEIDVIEHHNTPAILDPIIIILNQKSLENKNKIFHPIYF